MSKWRDEHLKEKGAKEWPRALDWIGSIWSNPSSPPLQGRVTCCLRLPNCPGEEPVLPKSGSCEGESPESPVLPRHKRAPHRGRDNHLSEGGLEHRSTESTKSTPRTALRSPGEGREDRETGQGVAVHSAGCPTFPEAAPVTWPHTLAPGRWCRTSCPSGGEAQALRSPGSGRSPPPSASAWTPSSPSWRPSSPRRVPSSPSCPSCPWRCGHGNLHTREGARPAGSGAPRARMASLPVGPPLPARGCSASSGRGAVVRPGPRPCARVPRAPRTGASGVGGPPRPAGRALGCRAPRGPGRPAGRAGLALSP